MSEKERVKRKGWKSTILGQPLSNEMADEQRLSNFMALPVFSSDALSSVAYATGEILLVLAFAGAQALHLVWWISLAIAALLIVVTFSYRQTIKAYPSGGGSYIVAKENLGSFAGLVAGSSLLVDYVLTVAVSVCAGTQAITSAVPALYNYSTWIALSMVAILSLANLRGVKEAGAIFALPTYGFVLTLGGTIVYGLFRYFTGGAAAIAVPSSHEALPMMGTLGLFLILKAFASGCTAMTGVEAIANGVQAFKKPESNNARKTLTAMAAILLFLFVGLSFLAFKAGVHPSEKETVISQIAHALYGIGPLYWILTAFVAAILVLAANTSYADFPRLASLMANDDYLPHQFADKGFRLVFSNGIIFLSLSAAVLIFLFKAETSALIPLYAIGVFASFTLSQSGMVLHHLRLREEGWRYATPINALGALVTGVVTVVIAVAKFTSGAWMVLIIIPILIAGFRYVRKHYGDTVRAAQATPEEIQEAAKNMVTRHNHVIILVNDLDRRFIDVLAVARSIDHDFLTAVHVNTEGEGKAEEFKREWQERGFGDIALMVIESPYREVIRPVVQYIRSLVNNGDRVMVVISDISPDHPIDIILHAQKSTLFKYALFFASPCVSIINVPFHMDEALREINNQGRSQAVAED